MRIFDRPIKGLPDSATQSFRRFLQSWTDINNFLQWVAYMSGSMDSMVKIAQDALVEVAGQEEKEKYEERDEARISMVEELKKNRQLLLEIVLTRHVDNYLNYLSSILYEAFLKKSELLRSSEKVTVKEVLTYDSLDSFIRDFAESKIERLSFSSFKNLSEFFNERLAIIIIPDNEIPNIVESIEIRNISVHNRCVINRRFITRTGADSSLIGKQKTLCLEYIDDIVLKIMEWIIQLDKNIIGKFDIENEGINSSD